GVTVSLSLQDLLQLKEQQAKPPIVCLCGSTRFSDAFQIANLNETLAGKIVLSIGCDTHSDEMLNLSPEKKIELDVLHLWKIRLADEVLILNVGGYTGESTRREIEYARSLDKPLRWLEPWVWNLDQAFLEAQKAWPGVWIAPGEYESNLIGDEFQTHEFMLVDAVEASFHTPDREGQLVLQEWRPGRRDPLNHWGFMIPRQQLEPQCQKPSCEQCGGKGCPECSDDEYYRIEEVAEQYRHDQSRDRAIARGDWPPA
ncbi:MAG: hypothetical protein J2P36_32045, partial [Ktedonobacteraceae bacterium]|nr:hypothetical protein [Ktedonobacteraceae bacterium]